MATPSIRYILGAVAAAAVLAGCGSQAQVTPSGAMAPSVARGPIADVKGGKKGGCVAHGGARVDPCSVTLTASTTSVTVKTRHPRDKKGAFSESDNCTSSAYATIATVQQSTTSANEWTVTAGNTTGSCTATFDYVNKRGKTVGSADLSITNS